MGRWGRSQVGPGPTGIGILAVNPRVGLCKTLCKTLCKDDVGLLQWQVNCWLLPSFPSAIWHAPVHVDVPRPPFSEHGRTNSLEMGNGDVKCGHMVPYS